MAGDGFILVYDDYPVYLKVDALGSHSATLLDAMDSPDESVQTVGEQQWQVLSQTNVLFLPQGDNVRSLQSLIKTVRVTEHNEEGNNDSIYSPGL